MTAIGILDWKNLVFQDTGIHYQQTELKTTTNKTIKWTWDKINMWSKFSRKNYFSLRKACF